MKWTNMAGALALLSAAAVFSTAGVFAAVNVDKVETYESAFYDDYFTQEPEPGIAEILAEGLAESSEETQSQPVSSEENSSESVSLPASSKPASSQASSKPLSSQTPSKPASSQASSKPVSSQEPVASVSSALSSEPVSSEEPSSTPESSETVTSEPEEDIDDNGESNNQNSALLDMVAGCVQREIVGVNTPPNPMYYEAYKAQAVAAHTYMEYQRRKTGSYPSMSYCKPMPQTVELVREVLDRQVCYNGAPINASYHAASGGHTQSAIYVWGNDVPYLLGVESAYDDYNSSLRISVSNMEEKLLAAGMDPSGDPSEWFNWSSVSYTDGDFINTIDVCGLTITGRSLRENILGAGNLKSPKITGIDCDGSTFTFTTKGFGHGAGLSQNGALGYAANEGWGYEQILMHYYVGTTVQ